MTLPSFSPLVAETDLLIRLRARFIRALALVGMVVAAAGLVVQVLRGINPLITLSIIAFLGLNVLLWLLAGRGQVRAAAVILVSAFTLTAAAVPQLFLLMGALALVSAATLGTRIIFIAANVAIYAIEVIGIAQVWPGLSGTMPLEVAQRLAQLFALGVVGLATRYFIEETERAAIGARRGAELLQAVAEISRGLANTFDLDAMLASAVDQVRDRLAFYHVQVFLVNEAGSHAELVASTGDVGQQLLARQHRLAVGSASVIGRVTLLGQPVIARDTDPGYLPNDLLPDTRAELAVPILDGDRIIGALDVQSRYREAFSAERVQALQVMANLLGTSIRNARLFAAQERSAAETRSLYLEAEQNLSEIQRLNQQLTRAGWEAYLRSRRAVSGVTLDAGQPVAAETWSAAQIEAGRRRHPVTVVQDGRTVTAVPMLLGEEVIGVIEIETDGEAGVSDAVETVEAVAQRLALSLDKARLFEESQEATAYEQRINDIVARYQTLTRVDDLLRITLTELSQSLGATHGAIRLSASGGNLAGGEAIS